MPCNYEMKRRKNEFLSVLTFLLLMGLQASGSTVLLTSMNLLGLSETAIGVMGRQYQGKGYVMYSRTDNWTLILAVGGDDKLKNFRKIKEQQLKSSIAFSNN